MTKTIFLTIDTTDFTWCFHGNRESAVNCTGADVILVESADDLMSLTGPQAVALYNATAEKIGGGLQPVTRFSDKKAAAKRLWANFQDIMEMLEGAAIKQTAKEATIKRMAKEVVAKARDGAPPAKATDYPAPKARRGTGINLAPKDKAYPCRAGSKQAVLVDLLNRPDGATMEELLEALSGGKTPWKEVSVKSGMNWDVNKVKGYGIRTDKRGDQDCYHLVLPEGMTAPLPHTEKKGA